MCSGSNRHCRAHQLHANNQQEHFPYFPPSARVSLSPCPPLAHLSRKNEMVFRASIWLSSAQPPHGHSSPLHLAREARCREECCFHVRVVAVERQGLLDPAMHATHHQRTPRPSASVAIIESETGAYIRAGTHRYPKKTSTFSIMLHSLPQPPTLRPLSQSWKRRPQTLRAVAQPLPRLLASSTMRRA